MLNSHNDDNHNPFIGATQKTDKHKNRRNERNRETSPETSSSDSGNISPSKDPFQEVNSTKSDRFQIISKSESHKWELAYKMADYVNHQSECFIAENNVGETFIILQPVRENERYVKKLENFVNFIMRQSAQVLDQNSTMEKFQQKTLDVMGFLYRLWVKNVPEDTVEEDTFASDC